MYRELQRRGDGDACIAFRPRGRHREGLDSNAVGSSGFERLLGPGDSGFVRGSAGNASANFVRQFLKIGLERSSFRGFLHRWTEAFLNFLCTEASQKREREKRNDGATRR